LKKLLEDRRIDEERLAEILKLHTYDEVIKKLDIKCIKIQNPILSFEKVT
jgi:hypothetical protein